MSSQELIDFGIWRDVGGSLDEAEQAAAGRASAAAVQDLREEGIEIEHVLTDVLVDEADGDHCVYCHYRAPSEEAVREHSRRAGERVDPDAFAVTRLARLKGRHEE